VGICTVGFEVLRDVLTRKSVYRTELLGVKNAGLKDTVELNRELGR